MFAKKNLSEIYTKYLVANKHPFARQDVLELFWDSNKKYKADILQMLEVAIAGQDTTKLQFCLAASSRDGLDKDYSNSFYKIILDTWHEEHEDLVDCVSNLNDERFCEPFFIIATDKSTYRKFDDELEATLRKCVHALIAINTSKSLDFLIKLKETQNSNVLDVMEMYK